MPRLTYNLTDHCNLRCAGCDQASPWHSVHFADLPLFEADLRALNQVCQIEELTFAGGEPLLHRQLDDFLRVSRENNFARELRMITNGVLCHTITDTILNYLDYIIISVYPEVPSRSSLKTLAAAAAMHNVFIGVVVRREFRHALLNSPVEDSELVRAIYKGCMLRVYCHTAYNGRYYRCSRAHTLEPRIRITGANVKNRDRDGVSLHGNSDLRRELAVYLKDKTPLIACHYCLGSFGAAIPACQMDPNHLVEAQKEVHGNPISLIDPKIDLKDPPEPQHPKPGWIREGFETLQNFLERVEKSGKSIEEFVR